jgi:ribosomal protein L18E
MTGNLDKVQSALDRAIAAFRYYARPDLRKVMEEAAEELQAFRDHEVMKNLDKIDEMLKEE